MSQGGGGGLGGSLTVLGGVGVLEERGAAGGPRGGGSLTRHQWSLTVLGGLRACVQIPATSSALLNEAGYD